MGNDIKIGMSINKDGKLDFEQVDKIIEDIYKDFELEPYNMGFKSEVYLYKLQLTKSGLKGVVDLFYTKKDVSISYYHDDIEGMDLCFKLATKIRSELV